MITLLACMTWNRQSLTAFALRLNRVDLIRFATEFVEAEPKIASELDKVGDDNRSRAASVGGLFHSMDFSTISADVCRWIN